jgi:hypothetical protein
MIAMTSDVLSFLQVIHDVAAFPSRIKRKAQEVAGGLCCVLLL